MGSEKAESCIKYPARETNFGKIIKKKRNLSSYCANSRGRMRISYKIFLFLSLLFFFGMGLKNRFCIHGKSVLCLNRGISGLTPHRNVAKALETIDTINIIDSNAFIDLFVVKFIDHSSL
jgi:hypothetical protein